MQFCSVADTSFSAAATANVNILYAKYQEMLALSNWESYLFHKSSLWGSTLVSLRTQIEFKIIQRLFLRTHKLPAEFNFARYSSHLFKVKFVRACLIFICCILYWGISAYGRCS